MIYVLLLRVVLPLVVVMLLGGVVVGVFSLISTAVVETQGRRRVERTRTTRRRTSSVDPIASLLVECDECRWIYERRDAKTRRLLRRLGLRP